MPLKIAAVLAGTAALTLALPAAAQEVTEDLPFAGIYVGGSGGYDVQKNDVGSRVNFDRNLDGAFGDVVRTGTGADAFTPGFCNGRALTPTAPGFGGRCRNDKDGASYYVRAGADTQRGNIVIGAMGEFGRTEITDSTTAFSTTPANYVFNRSIDWEASVRGRVGYAVNTTLFYGAAGPGYAHIDRSFTSSQSTNTFTGRGKRRQFGFIGGGGIEQKIGGAFSIGLEYTYHRYQDDDYRVRAAGPAGTPFTNAANGGTTTGTDFRRGDDIFAWHSLRGTVGFRF